MKTMRYSVCTILLIMICFGSVVCSANDSKTISDSGILLFVIDKSKEPYGIQLQNEILTQLKKQLKVAVTEESKLQNGSKSNGSDKIAKAEQPELLELANQTSSNQVLVVEILPVKSDLNEFLFYKSLKSEVTLRIRLFDAGKKQYMLHEEVSSTGTNKTFLPYTSVGKKVTVLEAVHKVTDIVAQKVNQTMEGDQ